jgi:lipopolysaccharide exporter
VSEPRDPREGPRGSPEEGGGREPVDPPEPTGPVDPPEPTGPVDPVDPVSTRENLTRGTVRGLSWVYGASAIGAFTQLLYTAIMGRLLAPEDFGLLAMALVFQRFGTYFARLGVGQALIQKAKLTDLDIRVGFTSSMLLGGGFGALVLFAAPLAGALFDTDAVVPVVRVLALTFLIGGFGRVSSSLLRRELRFRALAILEFLTFVVSYLGIGIGLALAGFGVWSLVAVQLAQSLIGAIGAFLIARHPLAPSLDGPTLRALFGYGSRLSIISFLEFIGMSLDTLVIGRTSGQERLGQYNRAYLLVNLPFHQIVEGLSRVLFPSFSQIQDDRPRLLGAYRSSAGGIAAVLLPLSAGLAVAAPEAVMVVIGPQWGAAAAVLPVLAFAGAVNFLSHLGGVICDATATLNRKLVLQLSYVLLLAALLLAAGTVDDLRAYAGAVLTAELVRHLMYQRLMGHVLGFGVRDHARLYGGPVVTGLAVALGIGVVTAILRERAPVAVTFATQIATGAVLLLASVVWGPLAPVRHDVGQRLRHAGLTGGSGRLARTAARVLDYGR